MGGEFRKYSGRRGVYRVLVGKLSIILLNCRLKQP